MIRGYNECNSAGKWRKCAESQISCEKNRTVTIIRYIICRKMKSQFETLLAKWRDEKTISAQSAKKMEADWKNYSSEVAGNRWTVAISTIGAILLGIAVISFISANWEDLSRFQKLFLGIFATLASFGSGYYFAYVRKNIPRTGQALIFLSTIAFGATLALISQVYQLSGEPWKLLAVWIVGILPVAYGLRNSIVFRLAIVLFVVAMALFLSEADALDIEGLFEAILGSLLRFPLVMIISLFLFALGSLHQQFVDFEAFGKILRMVSIKIFVFVLFWVTFDEIASEMLKEFGRQPGVWQKELFFAVVTVALAVAAFVKKQDLRELIGYASAFAFALLGMYIAYTGAVEAESGGFWLLIICANLLFIGITGTLLFVGYKEENLTAINFATFAIGAFIFGKYIDLFASLMDTTLFFLLGGVILIAGGIMLEKYRRRLVRHFSDES